jgi:hypothetical protein
MLPPAAFWVGATSAGGCLGWIWGRTYDDAPHNYGKPGDIAFEGETVFGS